MCRHAAIASLGDGRVGVIRFLHQGAEQAAKFRQIASQDRGAKIDITEQPIERVVFPEVRRIRRQTFSHWRAASTDGVRIG